MAPDRRLTSLRRDERRQLAGVALAALIPFIALAIWARFYSPAAWEPAVLDSLALNGGTLDSVVVAINTLGNLPVWAVVVALAALLTGLLRGVAVGLVVALSIASDLAAFGVKLVVERPRPPTEAVEQYFGPDSFAFPSGHVTRVVALVAIVIFVLSPARWRLPLALIGAGLGGVVMGYARVALGVHWPTDALGGFLLGVGWFALTAQLLRDETAAQPRG